MNSLNHHKGSIESKVKDT